MALTIETLQIEFRAQTAGMNAQLMALRNQLAGMEGATAKASGGIGTLMKGFKVLLAAKAAQKIAQVGAASLSMANDVVEGESLFEVSMANMASAARSWSEDLQDSLGLNAYTLRSQVGVFNNMFTAMGMGTQTAYDLSTSLVELAADMGSFYNDSTEEMLTKLRAGMMGEAEPLRRLGILVDEATAKQYAYATGIAEAGSELTAVQKVQARYAAIMAQTGNAQGDLARTIDSPVNQIRVLTNTLDQAQIALGQAFQPVQEAVLPLLQSLANAAVTAAQALSGLTNALFGAGKTSMSVGSAAKTSTKSQTKLAQSLQQTTKEIKAAGGAAKKAAKDGAVGLKAFDEINLLAEQAAGSGGGSGSGSGAIDGVNDTLDAFERLKQIDTSTLFGALVLTDGEIAELVAQVAAPFNEVAAEVDAARGEVDAAFAAFRQHLGQTGYLMWKANVQPEEFTGEDAKALMESVQAQIDAGMAAFLESEEWFKLAAQFTMGDGAEAILLEYEGVLTDYQSRLTKAGEDLNTAMYAWLNETDNAKKQELYTKALAKAAEYAQLVALAASGDQLVAKREAVNAFGSSTLSGESVQKLAATLGETQQDELAQLDAGFTAWQGTAQALLKADGASEEELQAAFDREFAEKEKNKAKLSAVNADFFAKTVMPAIETAYGELSNAEPAAWVAEQTKQLLAGGMNAEEIGEAMRQRMQELGGVADAMGPQYEDYKKLMDTLGADSEYITQDIRDFMVAYEALLALSDAPEPDVSHLALEAVAAQLEQEGPKKLQEALQAMIGEGWTLEEIDTGRGREALAQQAAGLMQGVLAPFENAGVGLHDDMAKALHDGLYAAALDMDLTGLLDGMPDAVTEELEAGAAKIEPNAAEPVAEALNTAVQNADLAGIGEEAGRDFAEGSQRGVEAGTPGVENAVQNMGRGMGGGLRNVLEEKSPSRVAFDIGENFSLGLANGIRSQFSRLQVMAAAAAVANAAIRKTKSVLGIASPSKVTEEFGLYFDEGLAGGILAGIPRAETAADMLAGRTFDALAGVHEALRAPAARLDTSVTHDVIGSMEDEQGALANAVTAAVRAAMDNLNITVPLEVDGYRLGRAAIRGMNKYSDVQGLAALGRA